MGEGLGIVELNPLIHYLSAYLGPLGFPFAFLIPLGGVYYLAGKYRASPRLVSAMLFLLAANETINVSLNLLVTLPGLAAVA